MTALPIGSFRINNPITLFSEASVGAFADDTLAGNIGAQIANRFRRFLDYGRRRIILEPSSAFGNPYDRAFSGLALRAEGADYRAFRVRDVTEPQDLDVRLSHAVELPDAEPPWGRARLSSARRLAAHQVEAEAVTDEQCKCWGARRRADAPARFLRLLEMHGLGHLTDRTVLEIGYGRLSQALIPSQTSAEVASAIDEKGRLRDSLSIDAEHQARRSSQYVRIRGGGKPIVSVPLDFADDAQPFVRTARDADDWIAAIEEALTLDPPRLRVARHPRPLGV